MISINGKAPNKLLTIDEVLAEDSWDKGYECDCGSDLFHVLHRFGETRVVCAKCDTPLLSFEASEEL